MLPSIVKVIYAVSTNTSIGALFVAGVIPGLILTAMLAVTTSHIARKNDYPRTHGVNTNKGFSQCGAQFDARGGDASLPVALDLLSLSLMEGIGGSMGPLYGSFFMAFAGPLKNRERLDAALFGESLSAGLAGVQALSEAKVGDKTLIDTLAPAEAAFHQALQAGGDFRRALAASMSAAAERGKQSTKALQAKVGCASHLGERSVGTLDAGAVSCCLILCGMAASIVARLDSRS